MSGPGDLDVGISLTMVRPSHIMNDPGQRFARHAMGITKMRIGDQHDFPAASPSYLSEAVSLRLEDVEVERWRVHSRIRLL